MSTPRNTAKADPLEHLIPAMAEKRPGESIENSEAQGQRELVQSSVIPADGVCVAVPLFHTVTPNSSRFPG